MKFYKVNDILYDQWYKKLENIRNQNTKQKQTYKQISFTHASKT